MFTVPIFLAVAVLALGRYLILVTPINVLFSASSVLVNLVLLVVSGAVLAPLLARAWCPVAARAAAGELDLLLPEEPLPPFRVFLGWWLLMAVLVILMAVPAVFVPRPFSAIMLVPLAIVVSGFHVRCALCVHAAAADLKAVLARTLAPRSFVWFPLALLPLYAWSRVQAHFVGLRGLALDIEPTAASRLADLLFLTGGAALFAVSLVLWAALALQSLADLTRREELFGRPPRKREVVAVAPPPDLLAHPRARAPAATPGRVDAGPRSRSWLLPAFGALAVLAAVGFVSRQYLLNWYLNMSDADYAQEHLYKSGNHSTEQMLAIARREAACRGNLARMRLIERAGVQSEARDSQAALICAAGAGHMAVVRHLAAQGVYVNATPPRETGYEATPASALQMAVDKGQAPMAGLLLELGADPNVQSTEEKVGLAVGPLHLAAKRLDLAMVRSLIAAGAQPGAPIPQPPMFYYVEALIEQSTPVTPVNWENAVSRALEAGLTLGGTDGKGANLLHMAATNGQFGLIEALLARGVEWRVPDNERALPFMHLLAWYSVIGEEPGPQLEEALDKLTRGLPNINVKGNFAVGPARSPIYLERGFSVARVASHKARVRQLFGDRIDYADMGGVHPDDAWRFKTHAQAEALIADMSPRQVLGATHLIGALQAKGWDDLAMAAAKKR